MLPSEMQALMAKILFFIFSITMLCMAKVRAENITHLQINEQFPQHILAQK